MKDIIEFSIGDILAELRLERHIKQKDVARQIGIAISTLSSYECGKSSPDTCNLTKLCDFYDVSADYILGRIRDKKHTFATQYPIRDFTLESCMDMLLTLHKLEGEVLQRIADLQNDGKHAKQRRVRH